MPLQPGASGVTTPRQHGAQIIRPLALTEQIWQSLAARLSTLDVISNAVGAACAWFATKGTVDGGR
jgi:hypothetical protein